MGESFPRVKFWLLPIFFVWGGGEGGRKLISPYFGGKKEEWSVCWLGKGLIK